MKFTFTTITALIAPILGQSITPAPTSTDPWYGSGPPWASSDPGKWSSIYESLLSAGKIPSTLTAAPWPTGSYGPGQGPWGPGGPHGPGGPGRHWGGKYTPSQSLPTSFLNHQPPQPSPSQILTPTPQAQTVPAPGAPPTSAPTATGPHAQTGGQAPGPHGGTAAHARPLTGPAGQQDPGVVLRRGPAGVGARLVRRRRALLLRR